MYDEGNILDKLRTQLDYLNDHLQVYENISKRKDSINNENVTNINHEEEYVLL
jgi:hypothetical protein